MKYLITGGCGFIGTSLVSSLLSSKKNKILNLDKLSYSANYNLHKKVNLKYSNYFLKKLDICNFKNLKNSINSFQPDIIFHLAAETHVDRSIEDPLSFINTNITGTYNLLEASRTYWYNLTSNKKKKFKLIHISTDEVYGDLGDTNKFFNEFSPYKPSSPYSASKASSDHLVESWYKTFGFPSIITNCSNNFGPNQFPEKLIPNIIINALNGKSINVYGSGRNVRDWIHVEDNISALKLISKKGQVGEKYNIGANNPKRNIDLVKLICKKLNKIITSKPTNIKKFEDLIKFVDDRPGHDFRYAINSNKLNKDLKWKPKKNFEKSIEETILWYFKNKSWWSNIIKKKYNMDRIGLIK